MTHGPSIPVAVRRKAVIAASLGNFIEWFEFTLYGFFAAAIATNFFPVSSGAPSLLATFAAFGVSFVLRPLGALVFGHYGDQVGRRTTLSAAIIGMSVSTFVIGVLPGYATLGILAPVMLLLARVVQGFSAGGEFGGATSYLIEYAPRGRRSLYGSWQFFTQLFAGFVASGVGSILSSALTEQDLTTWGWRIPFLLTLPLGLIGLYLRLRLDETPQFQQVSQERCGPSTPLLTAVREHWRSMLKVVGLILMGTTVTYMLQAFWPAFLVQEVGLSQAELFTAMLIGISIQLALIPLCAAIADRTGRHKPFLIASPLSLVFLTVPIYLLVVQGTFGTALLAYVLLALAQAPMMGVLATTIAEVFPTELRYSGLSIAYSATVSIFGGFTPLLLTFLVERTGDVMAPAYYLTATAVLSLFAAVIFTETGQRPTAPERVEAVS